MLKLPPISYLIYEISENGDEQFLHVGKNHILHQLAHVSHDLAELMSGARVKKYVSYVTRCSSSTRNSSTCSAKTRRRGLIFGCSPHGSCSEFGGSLAGGRRNLSFASKAVVAWLTKTTMMYSLLDGIVDYYISYPGQKHLKILAFNLPERACSFSRPRLSLQKCIPRLPGKSNRPESALECDQVF